MVDLVSNWREGEKRIWKKENNRKGTITKALSNEWANKFHGTKTRVNRKLAREEHPSKFSINICSNVAVDIKRRERERGESRGRNRVANFKRDKYYSLLIVSNLRSDTFCQGLRWSDRRSRLEIERWRNGWYFVEINSDIIMWSI